MRADIETLDGFMSEPGLVCLRPQFIPAAVLLGSHWSLQLSHEKECEHASMLITTPANVRARWPPLHPARLLRFHALMVADFIHVFSVRPS